MVEINQKQCFYSEQANEKAHVIHDSEISIIRAGENAKIQR